MRILRKALLGMSLLAIGCEAQEKELKELADSLASQVKSRGKGPVAITSFVNASYCSTFSTYLADRLSILMAKGNRDFDVVTRDRVEEVFKEINLALGQNYDSATFAKIGKQLGTRSLVRGSYTVQAAGASVSIAAQILDVETGRIIGGEFAEIRYTGDIKTMLDPQGCAGAESSGTSQPRVASGSADVSVRASTAYYGEKKLVGQLEVTLKGCRSKPEGVTCEALVKNVGEERRYCFIATNNTVWSRVIDEQGAIVPASKVQFGQNDASVGQGSACENLPSAVVVSGSMLVTHVFPEGTRFALVELIFGVDNGHPMAAQFRGVPMTK